MRIVPEGQDLARPERYAKLVGMRKATASSTLKDASRLRQRHLIRMPHLLVRGTWELLRARFVLGAMKPSDIRRLNENAHSKGVDADKARFDREIADRVAFIIPVLAKYVPWRSDCVIQAMAAQHWLAANGQASEIRIGVHNSQEGKFDAHAWLVQNERILTGGNIDQYAVLIGDRAAKAGGDTSDASPDNRT